MRNKETLTSTIINPPTMPIPVSQGTNLQHLRLTPNSRHKLSITLTLLAHTSPSTLVHSTLKRISRASDEIHIAQFVDCRDGVEGFCGAAVAVVEDGPEVWACVCWGGEGDEEEEEEEGGC
jgi:hypothetical protein